jgi:hypothetical protein
MKTEFKIVETENYVLAVSENVIPGDICLVNNETHKNAVRTFTTVFGGNKKDCKKIIAYKPKGNAPELDLPLLPYVEDDVEKLAEEYADFSNDYIPISFGGKFNETSKRDFIAGYKAATKVHSEDDMKKAYNKGFSEGVIKGTCSMVYKHESFEEYIQFLKQPKTPKLFVAENNEKCKCGTTCEFEICKHESKLKTTTNSEGKQVLVGTYLYD